MSQLEEQKVLFDEAVRLYAEKSLDFEEVYIQYSRFGYVYASPECIILAEPQGDTWFIQFVIGTNGLKRFLELMPYELPYVAWEKGLKKKNRTVKATLARLKRLI